MTATGILPIVDDVRAVVIVLAVVDVIAVVGVLAEVSVLAGVSVLAVVGVLAVVNALIGDYLVAWSELVELGEKFLLVSVAPATWTEAEDIDSSRCLLLETTGFTIVKVAVTVDPVDSIGRCRPRFYLLDRVASTCTDVALLGRRTLCRHSSSGSSRGRAGRPVARTDLSLRREAATPLTDDAPERFRNGHLVQDWLHSRNLEPACLSQLRQPMQTAVFVRFRLLLTRDRMLRLSQFEGLPDSDENRTTHVSG